MNAEILLSGKLIEHLSSSGAGPVQPAGSLRCSRDLSPREVTMKRAIAWCLAGQQDLRE